MPKPAWSGYAFFSHVSVLLVQRQRLQRNWEEEVKSTSKNKISIDLNIEKNKNSKVKDISGKITRYEIDLNVTMIIKDNAGNQVLEKKFQKTNDYDVRKNHSETIIKEKETAKTLGDQIAEDVIFFLNLFYKEKWS